MDGTEWQGAATMDGTGAGPSVGKTGVAGAATMDGTEWQNTASVYGTGADSETEVETWLFESLGAVSTDRHFFKIPIKNVVSLDRRFGVSMPMTSNFTL